MFKVARRLTKNAVAVANTKACEDMYKHLGTREGVNEIFKLAKVRNKRQQDINLFDI